MASLRRTFILGAGFSKPAGMPLATDLLPLIIDELDHLDEMKEWLNHLRERLAWLSRNGQEPLPIRLNIEEVFHLAHFDIEVHRLRQHLASVGRGDGPGTPWRVAESIEAWLSYMEDALRDVILDRQDKCNMEPILRWAGAVQPQDTVLTFNYDTLAERALAENNKAWSHGFSREGRGIPVCKLHGSIDWIVAHRLDKFSKLDLLFDKENLNRREDSEDRKSDEDLLPGDDPPNPPIQVEDDCRLWRCRTPEQLRTWIETRDVQQVPEGACERTVGIAGLGAYKQLHQIPGLGVVWAGAMQALSEADVAVVVGFSMSDFDMMAQMQFAEVARTRIQKNRPLRVLVIDPFADESAGRRFRRVFGDVDFAIQAHEAFDWSSLS